VAALAVVCASVLLVAGPATAKKGPGPSPEPAPAPAPAPAPVPAPTNLRVLSATPTVVAFTWDSAAVGQQGCLSPNIFWHLYQDGVFRGSLAPWIGQVFQPFGLTPGTTYRFQVQAQDNCTGAMSPLSEPLVVTTPMA
jgi:hypothetical protein